MKESRNWLIKITKALEVALVENNSSTSTIIFLKNIDGLDKFGYIKSALADDPLMIDVLTGIPITHWVLDEHKGELRESLEAALGYWFYDRSSETRDLKTVALHCLLVIDQYCKLRAKDKPIPGGIEELIFKIFDVTQKSN